MARSLCISALIGVGLPALLVLPGAPAQAATRSCKAAGQPAYELKRKRARATTLCLLNRERRARGLRPLREHRGLRRAAARHNRKMLRAGCFSHRCPGEPDLRERIFATSYLPCGCSWGVGENIAYGGGGWSRPRRIVRAWMGSPGHRANILSRSFERIGVAVDRGSPGGGSAAATYTTTFGYRE